MNKPLLSSKAPKTPLSEASSIVPDTLPQLPLSGEIWLASDIHLSMSDPATRAAFQSFLEKAAQQADALLLCGDIFDSWVGDDLALQRPEPWLADCLHSLQAAAKHLPLYLGRGNRDFLMGQSLAHHLGAHLLEDTVCLNTDYGQVLLSHGDEYCLDDLAYMRFRRIVRNPLVQRLFLSLPVPIRQRIAQLARQRSMASYHKKLPYITDVNNAAINRTLSRHNAHTLIHGHTHRPALHHHPVNGKSCLRVVLPDWDYRHTPHRGGWAVINQQGIELHYWC